MGHFGKRLTRCVRRTGRSIRRAGHTVEKHVVRPVFKPLNKAIKSLEKRGFVFNAQVGYGGEIGGNGYSFDYHIEANHKHWGVVIKDGDIGVNAHPQFKKLNNVRFVAGIGTDGFHADVIRDVEALDAVIGCGIDNDGWFVNLQHDDGVIMLRNGELSGIKHEEGRWALVMPRMLPVIPVRNGELTPSQAKRYLIFWDDLWNHAINSYPMCPIEVAKAHWLLHGIHENRAECFILNEEEMSERDKNYATKQLLLNDINLWNRVIDAGLRPYQLHPPVDATSMTDLQARRYILYFKDLFDAAIPHSRHFIEDPISWAKHHWRTHGIHEARLHSFDLLEPELAFENADYQFKGILYDNHELWGQAFDSGVDSVEWLKNRIREGE